MTGKAIQTPSPFFSQWEQWPESAHGTSEGTNGAQSGGLVHRTTR